MSSIPQTASVRHPEWCSDALCEHTSTDVLHREVGELLDLGYSGGTMTVTRIRGDELADRQVEYPGEVELQFGTAEPAMLSKAKMLELAVLLVATAKSL